MKKFVLIVTAAAVLVLPASALATPHGGELAKLRQQAIQVKDNPSKVAKQLGISRRHAKHLSGSFKIAHGHGDCGWAFYGTGNSPWSSTRKITQAETLYMAYTRMHNCFVYEHKETNDVGQLAFWEWINRTDAIALVWNKAGRLHIVEVDHDQTWDPFFGRWYAGFNVNATNN